MSLAAADKLLKIFDTLKNFREGIPVADPNPLAKKKETLLSKKDRISYLNTIPELVCSSGIRSLTEFPKILAITVDSLLVSCDDKESDVRLVAGESLNKLIKGLMDSFMGRILVELYKEIKKNDSARSLRAALSRFGDLCHLIRPQKCRPFIANLLPCVARVSTRIEETIQETLADAMQKIMRVLGSFIGDKEVKQLLKTFLPNLRSSSATTRRTAASSLVVICQYSRKPSFFYEWLLNILLGLVLPFHEDKDSTIYLGVLMCLRHMIPNLDSSSSLDHQMKGLRGSFGSQRSYSGDGTLDVEQIQGSQLLQVYELLMYCTKHSNHNVVTASLETLLQLLRAPPPALLSILLSTEGISPSVNSDTSKQDLEFLEETPSEDDPTVSELETASIAGSTASTVDTGVGSSIATDFDTEQTSVDEMLRSAELDHLRLHTGSVRVDGQTREEADEGGDVFDSTIGQAKTENRRTSRSLSDPGYAAEADKSASDDATQHKTQLSHGTFDYVAQQDGDGLELATTEDDTIRTELVSTQEVRLLVERSFQIDAVVCKGVPLVHCVRLMCSFLLSGNPGEMLSDSSVRVSVKSLALSCIAQAVKLCPEAFLVRILPESSEDSDGEEFHLSSPQLVRDILLFSGHGDPQLRGSLATVIGNVVGTGLDKGRLDFDTWCIDNCQEMETVPFGLEDVISVLKSILQDESPVAIRQACVALKSCLFLLCSSKHSKVALDLLNTISTLKDNSYWLVKVELLEILGEVDFRLLTLLKHKFEHLQESGMHKLFKTNLQEDLINDVLLHLLEDEDIRVRQAAAKCIVSIVPRLFHSLNSDKQALVVSAAQSQISSLFSQESHCKAYNHSVIDANLSRIVTLIGKKLNHSTSRTCLVFHSFDGYINLFKPYSVQFYKDFTLAMLGCIHVLSLLVETFPVASYPEAYGCSVSISCQSPLPTHSIGPFSSPSRPSSPSASCTGGGGPLSLVMSSMMSSWLAYDLFAHQQLLQIAGNILFGAGCSGVYVSLKMHSERGPSDEPISSADHWSVFTDNTLAPQAEKLVFHLARILNIFSHVVDHTTPGAHSFKIPFPGQNKDKQQSGAIPGVAAPQTPPSALAVSNSASAVPKRLLGKTKRALSEADLHQASSDKPLSPSKSQGGMGQSAESEQNTQSPPPKSSIGTFHHIPHYMKLYDIIKGAYANNQVSLLAPAEDKFCQFLSATLDSLSLLLEVTAFADIGKHVEEILGYLQVCVKLEAKTTLLCVQQLLRAMFGVNALSQPEMIQSSAVPLCLASSRVTVPPQAEMLSVEKSFYHFCFVYPLMLVTQSLQKSKQKEEVNEKEKETEGLGGIGVFSKRLRTKATSSIRPPVKLDKQSPIHSYIRWFEPLVIRALKEYTMSTNVILQQQVLSLLAQLIRLRVNYSLLDSDQVFVSYIQKQFEFIDAGQIKSCDTFLPYIFQFLVLLSYECYQPKFNQAKAIVGMPRIIQLCDGIMAGGQPAQTHAIPALQPIIHDLFVMRTSGGGEIGEDLETQREVVVSMLLRLVYYPEVLEMLVKVLNCYQRDEVKWKDLSQQIIDLLLPLLANQKVLVESEYGTEMLQAVFAAVAPGSLWPVDMLLRVLFSSFDQSDAFKRWLATTLVVLQTLMAQVTEDILLSRIDQSGFRPKCVNMMDKPLLPIEVFVKFLFDVVETSANHVNMVTRNSFVNLRSPSEEAFSMKLFGSLLSCVAHLLKSANFKKVSQVASSSPIIHPTVDLINESLSHLVDTHPVLVLQWCHVLRQLKFMDTQFWFGFLDTGVRLSTASGSDIELEGQTLNKDVTRMGVILIYCDLLITHHMEQGSLNYSQVGTLLRMSWEDLLQMTDEPPIQGLLSILYSTQEGSKLLLETFVSSRALHETMKRPSLMRDLLNCIKGVHQSQSVYLIKILAEYFLNSTYQAVARMAESLICKKLEICMEGQIVAPSQEPLEDELRSVCKLIASKKEMIRNQALLSLVTKILPSSPPVEMDMPSNEDLASSIKNYTINQEWFCRLAQQCCFAAHPKDQMSGAIIAPEAIQMLCVLSPKEVSDVINHENFDLSLLEECISLGVERTLLLTTRRQNGEEIASDILNNAEHFENHDVDQLLLISKLTLFSKIDQVAKDVIRTRTFRAAILRLSNDKRSRKLTAIKCSASLASMLVDWSYIELPLNDNENSTKLQCFHLVPDRLSALCNDADWCRKVTSLARALVFLAGAIPTLPKHCKIPESGQETLFQFVFVPLAMVHCSLENGKRPCSTELKSNLECLAKFLNLDCAKSIGGLKFFPLVCSAINYVHVLLNAVDGSGDNDETGFFTDQIKVDMADEGVQMARKACGEISQLIHRLLTILKPGSAQKPSLPQFLVRPFQDTIVGLARQPLVNSYSRTLPLVWKMGWAPVPEGPLKTELPPLPIEILKEKDVLDEFVKRVNLIGWTSRQQFEETWAALLGVISSPPLPDTVSTEEDMESTHSCCLAVRCISELLLQTTLYPVPGNPTTSAYLHRPRHRDLPFLGSRAGKKLTFVRGIIEEEFVSVCCTGTGRAFISVEDLKPELSASVHRSNSFLCLSSSSAMWITNRMLFDHPLYGLNIDRVLGFHDYTLGQISVGALHSQAQNELQERYDSEDDSAVVVSLPRMPQPEKLDIKSCEQFLLELFEQWMSLYIHPRTPLALLSEATKALLVLSDLFVDGTHFEWVLETLFELHHNHSAEDDLLIQYLLPTLCKALAFLKTEGATADRVCKIVESSLRSPHVPLQISGLYGAMYLLEIQVASISAVLLPILTDFLGKKLALINGAVSMAEHHLLVMWSTAFYLLERYADEISDQELKANLLKNAVRIASSNEDSTPTCVYQAIIRGLERLVVSFALSSAESDSLVKLSVDRLSMQNPHRAISALGLLVTCMYTGKIGDRPSGIYPPADSLEFPTEDILLIAMERVTVLFDRIRKGVPSEARVVARVLPPLLLDFFPAQEIMNKVIGEFLSSQQPHPELMAQVLFKVFEGLHSQGQQTEVRDWVLLSLGSFIQRTPLSMAVWSLTCFFISASNNKWIRALFSYIVGRMGKLEDIDVRIFCSAAMDFYRTQNLDATHKETLISTFRSAAQRSAPYREFIECCQSER